jgi:epoxyqueuosine reductase
MSVNYQKVLDTELNMLQGTPTLLLHSCCGPCSSYVLEYLSGYFRITVLYYNPNIYPPEEYEKRLGEERRLIGALSTQNPVALLEGEYNPSDFLSAVSGYENGPEGGARCRCCFELRLDKAAIIAKAGGFDYFTTTLSVSPHKNAELLNTLGAAAAGKYGVPYLFSDFKKRGGYKRSIELSADYGLYRQDYCGCEFSLRPN